MDQPYSAWADWLDTFHTSSEWIQTLWLIVMLVTVLGITSLLVCLLKEAFGLAWHRKLRGRLLYGVYEDADGQVLVYRDGSVKLPGRDVPYIPFPPSSPGSPRGSTSSTHCGS